jgi:nucleosome binding factor SPN SPT16 subunit
MVFNINAGFSGLVNDKAENNLNKNYALFVGDTVLVTEVSRMLLNNSCLPTCMLSNG